MIARRIGHFKSVVKYYVVYPGEKTGEPETKTSSGDGFAGAMP